MDNNDLEISEQKCCTKKTKYISNDKINQNNNNNNSNQNYYIPTINYNHNNMNLTNLNDNNNNNNNNNNKNTNLDNLSHNNVYTEENSTKQCCKLNFKIFKRSLPCLFAWTLLISTTTCYFIFVIPELRIVFNNDLLYWLIVLTIQSILFLYTVITFLIATFKDPGRYPKANFDDSLDDTFKSPLYKIVSIKQTQVKTKWCTSCNFYRPLRCSHCSVCDSCIDQFDHHCPWLANCVGKRNYRFFLQFLFFLILHMIAIFASCLLIALKTAVKEPSAITAIILLIIVGLLIFPIGGLFIFHLMLISKGRTTNEQVTGKYKDLNLFHKGFCVNFFYILCTSLSPKLITKNYHKKYLNKANRRRRQQQIDAFEAKYKTGFESILLT